MPPWRLLGIFAAIVIPVLLLLSVMPEAGTYLSGRKAAGWALAKIPWEGGPAYWANFSNTNTHAWENPAIFPIVSWGVTVATQAQVNADLAVGINTYMSVANGSSAVLVRTNNMWLWPGNQSNFSISIPSDCCGSETIGYSTTDEPDLNYGAQPNIGTGAWNGTDDGTSSCSPSPCGFSAVNGKIAALPADGRPNATNWASIQYPGFWNSADDNTAGVKSSVLSADSYWYSNPFYCSSDKGGALLGIGGSLTNDQCFRSSNYGAVTKMLQSLTMSGGVPTRPVWNFINTIFTFNTTDSGPTGPQLQGSIMSSLIHEARGILYFSMGISGQTSCVTQTSFRDSCGTATNPSVTAINGDIATLAPVLNTQSYVWSFNPNLDTMLKFDGTNWYIFTMQAYPNDSGTWTLTLPIGMTSQTTATVLFESRTVPISGSTSISDTFSNEYTWHIYKFAR